MGARPKGLASPSVTGLEPGVAPCRGEEAPWGAVRALWHMLRVTRVPECRVRLLVGARPRKVWHSHRGQDWGWTWALPGGEALWGAEGALWHMPHVSPR